MLYYLSVLLWLYLGIQIKRRILLYIGPVLRKMNEPSVQTNTMKNGPPDRTSTVKNGPAKRNIHNSRFREALEAHEDILEILSSLLANGASFKYFRLPNVEI